MWRGGCFKKKVVKLFSNSVPYQVLMNFLVVFLQTSFRTRWPLNIFVGLVLLEPISKEALKIGVFKFKCMQNPFCKEMHYFPPNDQLNLTLQHNSSHNINSMKLDNDNFGLILLIDHQ